MNASCIHLDLLLKVMKVADVYEFTLTKTGDRPVDMVSVDGKKYKLTVAELTSGFTTLQGKPIKIISLTKNKQYLAARLQSTPCYAVKVPKGSDKHIEMPNGQIVGPGKVIVIKANQLVVDGDTADVSMGTVMSEAFFRKTCVLKEISETFRKQLVASGKLKDENIKPMETPVVEASPADVIPMPQPVVEQPVVKPATQPTAQQTQQLGQIVRVTKYAGTDDICGYTVFINGEYLPFDVTNAVIACSEGLIGNATVVKSTTGKQFLRGVGIRLEDLPVDYL